MKPASDGSARTAETLRLQESWAWGRSGESYWPKPTLTYPGGLAILAEHSTLGLFVLRAGPADGAA
jgi:hypothetical protein